MSENTKLYNTVQVQKLEAELQESETVTLSSPLTAAVGRRRASVTNEVSFVHSYRIITIFRRQNVKIIDNY